MPVRDTPAADPTPAAVASPAALPPGGAPLPFSDTTEKAKVVLSQYWTDPEGADHTPDEEITVTGLIAGNLHGAGYLKRDDNGAPVTWS